MLQKRVQLSLTPPTAEELEWLAWWLNAYDARCEEVCVLFRQRHDQLCVLNLILQNHLKPSPFVYRWLDACRYDGALCRDTLCTVRSFFLARHPC